MAGRKFIPLLDRVLVERIQPQVQKTLSGIVLPESASGPKINEARVIAVGPGIRKGDGSFLPLTVKEGDTVCVGEDFRGTPIKLGDKDYTLYREDELLGIFPK
eukprot:TRINITY_DN919_c0_g1_i1.p1 TRINITY_DN919_c0_g1~~TRINITY_DN919_c0_g1_i1.p1  ORF type:complete len:103 (+),score=25.08 TRINITY_DN919_c0_g1_i1:225-533(+)